MQGRRSYIQTLAENGYACGLSGKWHLGRSALPQLGFDYWNVHATGGGNYYNAPMLKDGELRQPDGYVTDVITDNALDFLSGQLESSAPFSLNVHYTAAPRSLGSANIIPTTSSMISMTITPLIQFRSRTYISTS